MSRYSPNIGLNFSKSRILVSGSFAIFVVVAALVTVQKFFVFGGNEEYRILRSLIYNFLIFVTFGFWIIPSIKLQKTINKNGNRTRLDSIKIILLTLVLLISYPFIINILLFIINLSSEPISSFFLAKYFTGVIQVHVSVLFLIQLLIYLSEKKEGVQESKTQSELTISGLSSSVLWVESFDHYAKIHFKERTVVERISLKKLEENLPDCFVRIHRKFIVNLEEVNKIYRKNRVLYLQINGVSLRVSRSNEKKVESRYNSRQSLPIGDK